MNFEMYCALVKDALKLLGYADTLNRHEITYLRKEYNNTKDCLDPSSEAVIIADARDI